MNAWVIEPGHGSLWLSNCEWVETEEGRYIVGTTWDDTGVGHPNMPEDWTGERILMNFPESLVLRTV